MELIAVFCQRKLCQSGGGVQIVALLMWVWPLNRQSFQEAPLSGFHDSKYSCHKPAAFQTQPKNLYGFIIFIC